MERSKKIFGNVISNKVYNKAVKAKNKHLKKFGDDSNTIYHLSVEENQILASFIGVKNIVNSTGKEHIDIDKGIIIGNIRMGFGHYRISMAIASAAY